MEVTYRFKGLDLIDRVPEELWTDVHDIVSEAGIKTIPKEKKCKKKKILTFSNSNFISKIQMILIKRLFMVTYDKFNHFSIN